MILEIKEISKSYGTKQALKSFSAKLENGICGLLGANGAGKSTLMRILCSLQKSDTGEVLCDGESIAIMQERYYDRLGYLPQKLGYYPDFTVWDYLQYIARLKGIAETELHSEIEKVLQVVNLTNEITTKMKKLSGGMRQRVGIAQALLHNPQILILDEPTAGLDPLERGSLRDFLGEFGQGRIILYSTHIVSDIEHTAEHLLIMKEGNLICSGEREAVLRSLEGKVWECHVDAEQAEHLKQQYCVCNTRTEKSGVIVRLVADEPPCAQAEAAGHTLEDVYFYMLYKGEKA